MDHTSPDSPFRSYDRRAWSAVLIMAVAGALLYATEIRNYELWWHMATGRWVLENFDVPVVDEFSYTFRGEPWRFVNWFGGVILYVWWVCFGEWGLVPLKMLTMLSSGLLLALACRYLGVRAGAAAAAVFVALVLTQPRYSALRPMVQGTTALCAAMALGARFHRKPDHRIWWFVPLLTLWTQLHGTVMIGLGILGVLTVAGFLERRPFRSWALPVAVLFVSIAAMLTTTSGRALFGIVFLAVADDPSIQMMDEWARMSLSLRFVWVPLSVGVVSIVVTLAQRRYYPLGLALMGAILAAKFVRNMYEAIFLFAPAFAVAVEAVVARLERSGRSFLAQAAPYTVAVGLLLLQISLIPSQFLWSHRHLDAHFGFGVAWSVYPHDTYPTLASLPEGRTIHEIMSSGYLIWKDVPGGVFADGRTTSLYDTEWLTSTYVRIDRSPADLNAVADEYDIKYGLADYGRPIYFNMIFSNWTPIHFGDSTVVFVRDQVLPTLPNADSLELATLRFAEPLETYGPWLDQHYQQLLAQDGGRERLVATVRRARARGGASLLLTRIITYLEAKGYLSEEDLEP